MIYRRTERFKKTYRLLSEEIRAKSARALQLFQQDPKHPSLVVKKMKGYTGIWEGRIDQDYRFTFHFEKEPQSGETICVFLNIDNHNECLKNP
jgi:mRNA-degrading endonuclease RelE of RelBE toxin-antitoxin system